jgi:putative component of toxin-antitoxin plasmid stabilization module
MAELTKTAEFDSWIKRLRGNKAKAKVLVRLERLANGNPGDASPIGIFILLGGDKDSQQRDIEKAKGLARELE